MGNKNSTPREIIIKAYEFMREKGINEQTYNLLKQELMQKYEMYRGGRR